MFELSWIDLAVIIALAYAWGRWAQWRATVHNLLADPEYFADLLRRYSRLRSKDQPKRTEEIELRAEWLGDHCYLYRKDTGEFVGQGRDVRSAIDNASRLDDSADYVIDKEMATKPRESQP